MKQKLEQLRGAVSELKQATLFKKAGLAETVADLSLDLLTDLVNQCSQGEQVKGGNHAEGNK
jgi:hypothetical protein